MLRDCRERIKEWMGMSPVLGNLIVILVLGLVVALAVRSMWQSHKRGGHCNGDCASCGCCGGGKRTVEK